MRHKAWMIILAGMIGINLGLGVAGIVIGNSPWITTMNFIAMGALSVVLFLELKQLV